MYKLKNLIGHISSSSKKKAESRARTKVSRIPLNFFLLYYVDIDWNVLCNDIYCNLLVVVRLLWNNFAAETGQKRTKEGWKFMFDVGPLCCAAYYIARLRRLFYGSKYCHGIWRRKEIAAEDWLLGPWCLIKTKELFAANAAYAFVPRTLKPEAFKLSSTTHNFHRCWRFTAKTRQEFNSVPYWHFK